MDCLDEDCKELINCLENTLLACNDLTDNDNDGWDDLIVLNGFLSTADTGDL